MQRQWQMSESFAVGGLLAFVGGYLDAYTYICRGQVFCNAQTGNIVLLGMHLANGNLEAMLYYLLPMLAFVAGIFTVLLLRNKMQFSRGLHWRQLIVAVEIVLLFIICFIPSGILNLLVDILISFVCAMQVQAFRKLHGHAFATTMCTGNLRSATEMLFMFLKTRDHTLLRHSMKYYAIIGFFILGAAAGSFITTFLDEISVLICCGILAVVFVMMFIQERGQKSLKQQNLF